MLTVLAQIKPTHSLNKTNAMH